ncbi:MAG TPA: GNVR domain-containing protein, partial [Ignavibacteriaceae bacterium]|nr:GNVR domain-containing protein [Ignavibacteriaceae bacterium]
KDYMLAFKDIPELGRELTSILREVKIQNEVYIFLQQQFYKEKIQENRDMPTVQILDEAVSPMKASAPRLIFSTLIGLIMSLLLSSSVFVFKKKIHKKS